MDCLANIVSTINFSDKQTQNVVGYAVVGVLSYGHKRA